VMNFGRPQFVRDLMVANGDANKPIWVSEMAWNAVPDAVADKRFGQVSLEQQARYEPLAYQRALEEWPWAGVVNTWYFKRATDEWFKQGKPEAFFRLADPDFTLQPVYESLKAYIKSVQPALYPGTHEPSGWAVRADGEWQTVDAADQPFGKVWTGGVGAKLSFAFHGDFLRVTPACAAEPCSGTLKVTLDDQSPITIRNDDPSSRLHVAAAGSGLTKGLHQAVIEVAEAPTGITAISVQRAKPTWPWWILGGIVAAVFLLLLARGIARVRRK
ncbi:MAG TPA: hypothetical protein VL334_15625, partial [Anaerolineae bacterium]|nr:hypothetical protein [Anaerolineae bacterium]